MTWPGDRDMGQKYPKGNYEDFLIRHRPILALNYFRLLPSIFQLAFPNS